LRRPPRCLPIHSQVTHEGLLRSRPLERMGLGPRQGQGPPGVLCGSRDSKGWSWAMPTIGEPTRATTAKGTKSTATNRRRVQPPEEWHWSRASGTPLASIQIAAHSGKSGMRVIGVVLLWSRAGRQAATTSVSRRQPQSDALVQRGSCNEEPVR